MSAILAAEGAGIHYSAVLRALDELLSKGLIARIEVQRAYVAAGRHPVITLVCERCGDVAAEMTDLTGILAGLAQERGFKPSRFIVEASGLCPRCKAQLRRRRLRELRRRRSLLQAKP